MDSRIDVRLCQLQNHYLNSGSTIPGLLGTDFHHEALLYRGLDDYVAGTKVFIEDGLDADEPVMVAVPKANLDAIREGLIADDAARVRFVDMGALGSNPHRIIPEVRGWVDAQQEGPVRFIGEPIWPGRRQCEAVEATRHEALINLAFSDTAATILCPYDADRLTDAVLTDAHRTHPTIVCGADRLPSPSYDGHALGLAPEPLKLAPADAVVLPVTHDLSVLRRELASHAARSRLSPARIDDLVLAVTEAATNTLVHADEAGVVRLWGDEGHLVAEVAARGEIRDPLAGRHAPHGDELGGRGLWLVNQVCDLVEIRPGPPEAVLRLHLRLPGG